MQGDKNVVADTFLKRLIPVESRAPSTAQHRGPPSPLSRGRTSFIVLAMRLHPSLGLRVTKNATPVPSQFFVPPLKKKGGGAPEGANQEAASADAAAPSESSASLYERHLLRKTRRGLASRRSTAALATPIKAMAQSRPCFLGRAAAGVTCRDAVPVQRGTPRAGHNAGRSDARTAREQGYEPCPQEPHPPSSIGRHRLTSLRRMDGDYVTVSRTSVNDIFVFFSDTKIPPLGGDYILDA
jgi:hypothetical protein